MRNYFISASLIAGLLLAYTALVLMNRKTANAGTTAKHPSAYLTIDQSSNAAR